MSYIGSSSAVIPVGFSGVNSQSFNGDGSTVAFTLNRPVSAAKDVEVMVNNVQQSPYDSSYSVSGTTLTFSAAPSSGTANIYVTYRDQPVGSITDPNTYTKAQTDTLLDAQVAKTGDTMTGALTIQNAGFDSKITLQNTGTGGQTFNVFSTMDSFTQGGGNLLFHTSSAPNGILKMDSAGRVTMPYQPAFQAYVTSSASNWTSGQTIVFDNTAFGNRGGHYNSSNGKFTAPIYGVYHFHFMTWKLNTSALTVKPLKNGAGIADTFWMYNMSSQSAETNTVQFTIPLAANDTIEISVHSGTAGGDYSNFGGYLIG